MIWKQEEHKNDGTVNIPERWLFLHYYEAFNILFRFENSLRVFVYAILKNEYKESWIDCSFEYNGKSKSIKSISNQRISQAENFGYLSFDVSSPIMHLTSGELIEFITCDAYWSKFSTYFKANKNIIKNKLLEIGAVRNSLAHFRPIKPEDIELIKLNSRHTLMDVETCLQNIFLQNFRVPTNTQDLWYKEISTLGNELISIEPHYSSDENWINIKLKFNIQILKKDKYGDTFYTFTIANINTPKILMEFPELAKYVTYINEYVNYPLLDKNNDVYFTKDLHIVFRKDVLTENYENVASQLKEILLSVSEECELLKQDNLARGKLTEPTYGSSWWQEEEGKTGMWQHNYSSLSKIYEPQHPNEYWGQHSFTSDIVAGSQRYPWMPTDISKVERTF